MRDAKGYRLGKEYNLQEFVWDGMSICTFRVDHDEPFKSGERLKIINHNKIWHDVTIDRLITANGRTHYYRAKKEIEASKAHKLMVIFGSDEDKKQAFLDLLAEGSYQ